MGAYIYRVTAERVRLTDGREANATTYAYKPSSDTAFNKRMEFRTGIHASRRLEKENRLTGLIVFGGLVWEYGRGTFNDDALCHHLKPLEGVFPIGRGM